MIRPIKFVARKARSTDCGTVGESDVIGGYSYLDGDTRPDQNRRDNVEALEMLVARLLDDGWESICESNRPWWKRKFRRAAGQR